MPMHFEIYKLAADPRTPMEHKKIIFTGISVNATRNSYMYPSSNSPMASNMSVAVGKTELLKQTLQYITDKRVKCNISTHYPVPYEIPSHIQEQQEYLNTAAMYEIIRTHNPSVASDLVDHFGIRDTILRDMVIARIAKYPEEPRSAMNRGFKSIDLRESNYERGNAIIRKQLRDYNEHRFVMHRESNKHVSISAASLSPTVKERYLIPETNHSKPLDDLTVPFTEAQAKDDEVSACRKLTYFFMLVEALSRFPHLTGKMKNGTIPPKSITTAHAYDIHTTSRAYVTEEVLMDVNQVTEDTAYALSRAPIPIAYTTFNIDEHMHDDEDVSKPGTRKKRRENPSELAYTEEDVNIRQNKSAFNINSRPGIRSHQSPYTVFEDNDVCVLKPAGSFPLWASRLTDPLYSDVRVSSSNRTLLHLKPLYGARKEPFAICISSPVTFISTEIVTRFKAQFLDAGHPHGASHKNKTKRKRATKPRVKP
jgi:hypothetical protein